MTFSRVRNALAAGAAMLSMTVTVLVPVSAYAQFGGIVYDPSNYSQNILTAARTLEQINNQIKSLQNEATSLINQAKNLATLPLSVLAPLQAQIKQTQQLLAQAQRMAYDVQQIETQFAAQYKNIDLTAPQQALVTGAENRWKTSVGAFEDALKVQAGVVANIGGARTSVNALVTASQSSSGALQAAQAGNQLLALQSLDAAQKAAAQAQGREQLRRFLTPGTGYHPGNASMFHN
jgi:type IV secretion system protein TrbJ